MLPDLDKELEHDDEVLAKLFNIKFNENPFTGSRVVACVQTDGRRDFNRRSVALRTYLQLQQPSVN